MQSPGLQAYMPMLWHSIDNSMALPAPNGAARKCLQGIWSGSFEYPADWRKDQKRGTQQRFLTADGSAPDAGMQQKLLPAPSGSSKALPAVSSNSSSQKDLPEDSRCQIKGNINAKGSKIYHVPGSAAYDSTVVDTRRQEQWFCSEQEAQKAGFRAATR